MTTNSFNGFTQCQDGHRCFNGSLCTENPYDEGSFYCDCDEAFVDNAVSGLSCEHVATAYCVYDKEVSMTSFCTNHGTCKAMVSSGEAHLGCNCPDDYEGEHCQFVKGTTRPNNWPGASQQNNWGSNENEKLSGGVTAVIVLICLGLVAAVGFLVYKKKKNTMSTTVIGSPDLQLEADGEVLQRAVKSGVHNTSSRNGTAAEIEMAGINGSSAAELDADGGVLKEAIESKSPAALDNTPSMEDVDVSSPTNGDENGGGGLV